MRDFCTYFDSGYLARGLALHDSLLKHAEPFRLWILCMDELSYEILQRLGLKGVNLVRISELEAEDPALAAVRDTRSRVEYYFTCTPAFPLYLFSKDTSLQQLTYLDADLFFFADPQPVFDESDHASVAIIEHRFAPALRHLEVYGRFNVGWITFRADKSAAECLDWWRDRCLEWCYDRLEGDRFADQKYLDQWPARFAGVTILQHPGANLAPWNVSNFTLSAHGGRVFVEESPLIFFHFHGLKDTSGIIRDPHWRFYELQPGGVLRKQIYRPYLRALRDAEARLGALVAQSHAVSPAGSSRGVTAGRQGFGRTGTGFKALVREVVRFLIKLLRRQLFLHMPSKDERRWRDFLADPGPAGRR